MGLESAAVQLMFTSGNPGYCIHRAQWHRAVYPVKYIIDTVNKSVGIQLPFHFKLLSCLGVFNWWLDCFKIGG